MKDYVLKLQLNACSACSIQLQDSLNQLIKAYPNIKIGSADASQSDTLVVYYNDLQVGKINGYQPFEIIEIYLGSLE